ncbi:MAG: hypothetical protein ACR2NO_01785 [Chloroflexota bacterium]
MDSPTRLALRGLSVLAPLRREWVEWCVSVVIAAGIVILAMNAVTLSPHPHLASLGVGLLAQASVVLGRS